MSTHDTTRRTDSRTDREELEAEAPLCPDLGDRAGDSTERLYRELRAVRTRLDRIERRLEERR
jgi:hypothetical protein